MSESEEIQTTKKFFKIGEVSKMLKEPASTLRYWEKEFRQLRPMKNKKGDRIYSLKDIEILKEIKYLTHEKGLKLSKATVKLKKEPEKEDSRVELVKRLRGLRDMLVDFKDSLD